MSLNIKIKSEQSPLKRFLVIIAVLIVLAALFLFFYKSKEEAAFSPDFKTFSGINVPESGNDSPMVQDFDDWRFKCNKTKTKGNASQSCHIFQRLTRGEGDNVKSLLTVMVVIVKRKIPEQDELVSVPVLRFITPLGVDLLAGVGVKFSEEDKSALPYQTCAPVGCVAEKGLNKKALDYLHGDKPVMVAYQRFEKGAEAPLVLGISPKGFAAAFKALVQEEN